MYADLSGHSVFGAIIIGDAVGGLFALGETMVKDFKNYQLLEKP